MELMENLENIEQYYQKIIQDLPSYLPEGLVDVDIDLLSHFHMLEDKKPKDLALTRYFQVIESSDKVTLINNQFVVWILADHKGLKPKTFVLIALRKGDQLKLELGFRTSDIYNTSQLVLRLLENYLHEIQENEDSLKPYGL